MAATALPCAALDPSKTLTQYAHRIWGEEEGLFRPTIYSILQSRDGFLWLGTQDSLIRFDGLHFRDFEAPNGQAIFQRTLVRALLEDHAGNLWIGSVGAGIAKIDAAGAVTRYTSAQGLPSDNVFCLAGDSQNAVWACTNEGLVMLADGNTRVFTTADGLASKQIRATCVAPDGTRWVAGLDFGLSRSVGTRFQVYSDALIRATENISALECSQDGSIWAGTPRGLVRISGAGSRLFSTRDGLPDNAVSSLANGPDGSVWIGTNDGISRFRHGEISVYRTRDGLSHSLVLSLYVDREGSLWAGTKDGLDQFTDGKVTPYGTNEGMLSNDAGPVLEDDAHRLWAGTLDRGLNWFDGHKFHAVTRRDGLLSNTILSLAKDGTGDLWAGTDKGLNRLSGGQVVASFTRKDGLSGSEIRALFVDHQGTLWVGTEKGLDRFDGNRFTALTPDKTRKDDGVLALGGGQLQKLFVSTAAPALYAMGERAFAKYPLDVLRSVDCYFLDDGDGRHSLWMGTSGSGLLRSRDGVLTHVRVKDGLYDNRIFGILRDENANFWLASSKGIFRVSQQELEDFADGKTKWVTSIPFSTGQLRFECQSGVQPAACRTHDGRLWFSTTNGLVSVDPMRLESNQAAPPVQFTSVLIDGQRIVPRGTLVLKPSEKNIEIRYAGLSFVSPERVTFRYALEGFDKTWTDAGTRREAFFTNLPPGHFRFSVTARNADGRWSTAPAVLAFTIEPRLYQRTWFFPLLASVLALAVVAGYRIRVRQLQHGFDLVLGERGRIARELHDTLLQELSGITMQLQALWTKLPESRERQFLGDVIKDAARCSREARQSVLGLRSDGAPAQDFADRLTALARDAVAGKPLSLETNVRRPLQPLPPEVDYQLLRIAREAIANTLSHARAKRLWIELKSENEGLLLTFEDDGTGFEEWKGRRLGHFGLIGMRERAREIGADIEIASTPGRGTRISVQMHIPRSVMTDSNAQVAVEHHLP